MKLTCPFPDCGKGIPPGWLACPWHWHQADQRQRQRWDEARRAFEQNEITEEEILEIRQSIVDEVVNR